MANNDIPNESPSRLRTSPTAQAFFQALDTQEQQEESSSADEQQRPTSTLISQRLSQLGWRNRHSQSEYYPISLKQPTLVHFTVRQVQRGEVEGTYGTGATVWPASLVLIKYLERHCVSLVQGKRVIDLGAGTGVTSIAAACLGARSVVCTDGEASVVQLARDNVEAASKMLAGKTTSATPTTGNDSCDFTIHNCPIHVQKYWWGKDTIHHSKDDADSSKGDLILVSDCVLPKLYPIAPLVDALDELLPKDLDNGSMAVLSYEHRHYAQYHPKEKFCELAQLKSLHVETVPASDQDPVYSADDIEIWKVTRRL